MSPRCSQSLTFPFSCPPPSTHPPPTPTLHPPTPTHRAAVPGFTVECPHTAPSHWAPVKLSSTNTHPPSTHTHPPTTHNHSPCCCPRVYSRMSPHCSQPSTSRSAVRRASWGYRTRTYVGGWWRSAVWWVGPWGRARSAIWGPRPSSPPSRRSRWSKPSPATLARLHPREAGAGRASVAGRPGTCRKRVGHQLEWIKDQEYNKFFNYS